MRITDHYLQMIGGFYYATVETKTEKIKSPNFYYKADAERWLKAECAAIRAAKPLILTA